MGARSVLITRGCGWEGLLSALRNSRLAASASGKAKAENQWWPRGNRWPGTGSTSGPALERSLVHSPGLVGRLKMAPQPLLEFGRIALYPAPQGGMIRFRAAFLQQLLHVSKRPGITQVPADRAKSKPRFWFTAT